MGISSYFRAKKPEIKRTKPVGTPMPTGGIFAENVPPNPLGLTDLDLHAPLPNFGSSRNSFSERSARSINSSVFLDDIKHEVMVNYLYQQQCAHLWVSDGSGDVEGVLLRKSKGTYMACPPALADSLIASACSALNVQVI